MGAEEDAGGACKAKGGEGKNRQVQTECVCASSGLVDGQTALPTKGGLQQEHKAQTHGSPMGSTGNSPASEPKKRRL